MGSRIVLGLQLEEAAGSHVREMDHFQTGFAQEVQACGVFVFGDVHHPLDAGLQDQLAAIAARRQGNVQRAPLCTFGAAGHFQNGVCLGVQNVPFGLSAFFFSVAF